MTLHHLIILALVQGITEFLPVSSSGHLALTPKLMGVEDQGLTIDVATHVGTLFAVILYFWRDVKSAMVGPYYWLAGQFNRWEARLAWLLILGTIPVVIVGFILSKLGLMDAMRSIKVIAWTTLIYGLVLYVCDRVGPSLLKAENLGNRSMIMIGLAQALALIPGTSRSGITMSAARLMGFKRTEAARVSMLMSIPTIIAAGTLSGYDLWKSGDMALGRDAGIAAGLSFISALISVHILMRMLRGWTFTPFVIYRILLGGALLWIAYA